jgi:hypothetical protein
MKKIREIMEYAERKFKTTNTHLARVYIKYPGGTHSGYRLDTSKQKSWRGFDYRTSIRIVAITLDEIKRRIDNKEYTSKKSKEKS